MQQHRLMGRHFRLHGVDGCGKDFGGGQRDGVYAIQLQGGLQETRGEPKINKYTEGNALCDRQRGQPALREFDRKRPC